MFNMFEKKDKKPQTNSTISDNNNLNSSELSNSLKKNISDFNEFVGINHDVNTRNLKLPIGKGIDASIMFVDGLVDKCTINDSVIKPLLTKFPEKIAEDDLLDIISERVIKNLKLEQSCNWNDILDKMFSGDTILFVDGYSHVLIIGVRKWLDRGVQETGTEQVISGPKDSFSETLLTNTMLVRRRIKSHKLKMEYMTIGTLTKTDVILSYVDGVVNPKLVEEVRSRLNRIETDSIIGSHMIEEFIEDSSFAMVPQIIHTERPDKAVAHILEGGVIILVDGTPMVLMLPIVFWQFLYSPEDYNERLYTSFLLRSLRFVSLFIALTLPSFYIAVSSFHHEMIPIGLLQVIVSGRRDVPFPVLVEVIIMELILEVIREAGVRLPRNVGQAISIVGALVLGQAAIQAKLASPATVTVVAITAIANFTIPSFSAGLSIRVFRFVLMLASGLHGILGFTAILFVILVHLCSLRSFGVPFLAPFAPLIPGDLKDSQVRLPIWAMNRRPQTFGAINSVRQKPGLKPGLKPGGKQQ
ncbi:MAG: hypothetical protein A2Y24_06940 [Clostridiales bacterium GWE2_32_10]|nr:MAG: hypothetical protein A2Y24_06940 [Clostridiales bacterium GWE2_32_10]